MSTSRAHHCHRRRLRAPSVERLEDRLALALVAAFGFEEGSGTVAADASNSNNTGTLSGPTWSTSGKYGKALLFDGVNDWVTVNDANSLDLTTGMTLEAWVNPGSITADWRAVLLKERPGGLAYALYGTDGASRPPAGYVNVSGVDIAAVGSTVLPLNTWSHLAATYDGTTLRTFVNGVQVGTRSVSGAMTTSTGTLRIGGNSVWGEWFSGLIDEVRFYNTALTAVQIQADMTAPVGSVADSTPPTVALSAPADGATVTGSVAVTATATDNVGVAGVQFQLDGVNLGAEDLVAPYGVSWNTTGASGSHTLRAIARDAAGNATTSAAVNVTVTAGNPDNQAPTVSISSPVPGATVTGTITVAAMASDNVGVVGVQFQLDGANLGAEDATAPYSVSWSTANSANGGHTLTAVARDAAGNSTTSPPISVTVSNGAGGTPLTIDGSQRFQTIDGFGVNANVNSWDDGALRPAISLLADDLGASLWRVYIDKTDWETTNDNADPATFNWAYYNTLYATPRFEEAWGLIGELNAHGITSGVILNFMGAGPDWMGGSTLDPAQEDEWIEMILSYAYYARFNRGLQFGRLSPFNEPDWDGKEGIRVDPATAARVLGKIAHRLDELGMSDVRLVAPETAQATAAAQSYIPEMLARSDLMAKVDDFGFHSYAGSTGGVDAVIRGSQYSDRGFWVTEQSFGSTQDFTPVDQLFGFLDAGATATLVFKAYDGQDNHHPPGEDFSLGLLQYNAGTQTYSPRPGYDIIKPVQKFVRPGMVRIAATESSGNLHVEAFHDAATGQVAIVGRNTGGGTLRISGSLANLPSIGTLQSYWATATSGFIHGSDVSLAGNAFTFDAPGNSVFTLVSAGPPDTAAPTVSMSAPADGATVTGTINVSALASDNVGVAGVQFQLDGVNLGGEDLSAPFTINWDTTAAANGGHQLRAVARDAAGNSAISNIVAVTVHNFVDTQAPAVSISAPADHATVVGTINVVATANDDIGVVGVQFLLDGNPLGAEDLTSPYSVSWNTTSVVNGTFTLTARARDAAGNSGTSDPISVTVANFVDTTPPTVSISSPAGGATVSGNITVSGNASDDVGVVGVQFLLDGNPLGAEDLTSPYSVSWNTASASNGSHTLTARARDAAGHPATSSPVSVTVSNSTPPPTGLVAAYGFGAGAGTTVADASGSGNSGTISGAAWTAAGKFGGALSFDGVNDWVTVADANSLDLTTGVTLEAWVKTAKVAADWSAVLLKERPSGLAYALYATDGASRPPAGYINRSGSDRAVVGTSLLPVGTWSHLAMTYNGSTMRLYVNGAQVATRSQTGATTTSTGVLRFGGNSIWGEWFAGVIDEVRIYNRAISTGEIQTDMNLAIDGGALLAAGLSAASPSGSDELAIQVVAPLLDEAKSRWRTVGLSPGQSAALDGVRVQVADLPGNQLGFYAANTIWLDHDAAGRGWFVDPTPRDDAEFAGRSGGGAADHYDLLTVLAHEMGHALGLDHDDEGVMGESLPVGARRVPGESSVDMALVELLATSFGEPRPQRGGGALLLTP